jgi:PQQ-like domain
MRTRSVLGAVAGVAVVAAVAAVAVPVVRHSDALTTTIRTAPTSPAAPETAPLPATVRQLWSVPTGASAAPVAGPSVVQTGPDRVAGLDPATGLERWSYQRDNATLCGATRQDGVVLVLFAKSHGCRDLTALDAGTGARRWYRTLELSTGATLTSGPGIVVATGANQMIAVDTGGGLNRWTYSAATGCVLDPAVVGRAAVATVARCPGNPNRLVVHQPFLDKAPWTGPLSDGPDPHVLTAETQVTVLAGNTLSLFSTTADDDGKITASPADDITDDRLTGSGTPAAVLDGDFLVAWTGTGAVGVDIRNKHVLWTASATGPPTLAEGQVLLAAPAGFTLRPAATGTPVTAVQTGNGVPAGAGVSRIGRLVIVAGDGRLVGYG